MSLTQDDPRQWTRVSRRGGTVEEGETDIMDVLEMRDVPPRSSS